MGLYAGCGFGLLCFTFDFAGFALGLGDCLMGNLGLLVS